MKLPIPPLSQKDDRWGRKRLGTSSVTIGSYGCYLVCLSMLLKYYGKEQTPDVLNELLKSNDGYINNNLIRGWSVTDIYADVTYKEHYQCIDFPCDLSKIDDMLNQRKPVIAMVDFSTTPGLQTHFVLIIGKDEAGSYLINDPWYGDTVFFQARYGEPARFIYGLRIYDGKVKEASNEDQILELKTKIQALEQSLADKQLEVGQERSLREDAERSLSEVQEVLVETRTQRDTAIWEADGLRKKVEDLEKEIEKAQGDIDLLQQDKTALKEALRECRKLVCEDRDTGELVKIILSRLLRR